MSKMRTAEDFDRELEGRQITRLEDYKGGNHKIKFQCGKCFYIWSAAPTNMRKSYNHKCPKCVNRVKKTNQDIDELLIGRNITRIDDIINTYTKITFQCDICLHQWKNTPKQIKKGIGCPKCSRLNRPFKYNNETYDQKIAGRTVSRVDDYNGSQKITFKCHVCLYQWLTYPTRILGGYGCPQCAGSIPKTNENIDKLLENRDIIRIDNFINTYTKITFQCTKCLNYWMAKPNNVLNGTGCPNCATGKNENIVFNALNTTNFQVFRQFNLQKLNSTHRKLYIDFYLPEQKTFIEYNGPQHYIPIKFGNTTPEQNKQRFIKQQERDQYLEKCCIENNIQLIWIDGRKYLNNKLEKHMVESIIPLLKKASNV